MVAVWNTSIETSARSWRTYQVGSQKGEEFARKSATLNEMDMDNESGGESKKFALEHFGHAAMQF